MATPATPIFGGNAHAGWSGQVHFLKVGRVFSVCHPHGLLALSRREVASEAAPLENYPLLR